MKELGLSQTDLAKRMQVSRPYITKVLRQDVNFSFRTAAKLARALKMDFSPELHPSMEAHSIQQREYNGQQ
jgi:transcriptional regulator with XRE-family HTH domain